MGQRDTGDLPCFDKKSNLVRYSKYRISRLTRMPELSKSLIICDRFRNIGRLCWIFLAIFVAACSSSDSTEEDGASHFTMTTEFLGRTSVLTVIENSVNSTVFEFTPRVDNQRNQEWFFQRDENGSYRIVNRSLGEDFSLDVANDGVFETLIMAPSSDASGQIWQATLLDNGYCRLTNSFLGAEIALDVVSDTDELTITMRSMGDFSGQHWSIRQQGMPQGLVEVCDGEPV